MTIDIKTIRAEAAEGERRSLYGGLNPNTVLALCDEIERLRTALKPLSNELLLSRWQVTPVLDNLEAELCWQDYRTLYEHFAAMHGITGESK